MTLLRPFLTLACIAFAPLTFAQSYPTKPIRFIVGFALYIRREIVKWAKVVKDSGANAD